MEKISDLLERGIPMVPHHQGIEPGEPDYDNALDGYKCACALTTIGIAAMGVNQFGGILAAATEFEKREIFDAPTIKGLPGDDKNDLWMQIGQVLNLKYTREEIVEILRAEGL